MILKVKSVWILLAVLALSGAARAVLTLDEYQKWQSYNGLVIRSIAFHGIHSFTRGELLNSMATEPSSWLRRFVPFGHVAHFYADDYAGDLFRIEHFYAREGFPHAMAWGDVFTNTANSTIRLRIKVVEGPPLVLTGWNLEMGSDTGAFVDSAGWSKFMPIKIGKRLTLADVRTSADTLAYKMRDWGYARAMVTDTILEDTTANTAHVTFTLYPGHYSYMGPTHFIGLKQFAERDARRELAYKKYEPFALTKLADTRENLLNLQLFNFASVRPDTSVRSDTLPIIIHVEEGKRYHVSGGAGYDTRQHARATAEFRDLNFFSGARRFTLDGSVGELQRTVQFTLFWPHAPVHATNLTLNPSWNWQKFPSFITRSIGNTTIFSATPLRKVTTAVSNEFGTEKVETDSTGQHLTRTSYVKSVETASITWDTRDNPLVPRRGHVLSLSTSESGLFYGTEIRWWRIIAQASALVPRGRFITLAGRAKFGVMGPLFKTPVTPPEERFFFGGPADVRGWKYQTLAPRASHDIGQVLGGNMAFAVTGEMRRALAGPLSAAVFVDAGNVWPRASLYSGLDLYPSLGLGLMYNSIVGPLRIDYAHQLRRNPFGEQKWNIDISVGATF
jgi:outer membrane protein insertion porin family